VRPQLLRLGGGGPCDETLDRAAQTLASGGLVAFPTDTVYGLGADILRPAAIDRLYNIKGRERAKPLARLAADAGAAEAQASSWPRLARKLARAYWPGALTIVVGDVGVRVPDHAAARGLASRAGGAVAATSANRSGMPEPRTAGEVVAALGAGVELVIDGGRTAGVPSTVVRVEAGPGGRERIEVLRRGAIPEDELRLTAASTVLLVCPGAGLGAVAGALFAAVARERGRTDVTVLVAVLGAASSPTSMQALAAELGIDARGEETPALSPALLARADWVYALERSLVEKIAQIAPPGAARAELLDPAGRDMAAPGPGATEKAAAATLREAVRARAELVLER